MTRKAIIKRAYELERQLQSLQRKLGNFCVDCEEVEESEDFDDFSLRAMRQVFEELVGFDLIDCICNADE